MSLKMESKLGTPSVLARLMGLDEPSHHQPVQKKQRVLSDNYLRRVASIGVSEKCHSFRLSFEEKKEFKDGSEVLGKLKREKDYNLSVKNSVDMQLHSSKEGHDALGVVDYKKNLSAKDLQKPDSLVTKHHHDLQGIHYSSQSGCVKVLRSSYALYSRKTDTCGKHGRGIVQGSEKAVQKLGLGNIDKFVRSPMELENGTCLPPTKIVVLKPILGSSSNGNSYSISMKNKEFLSHEEGDIYVDEQERKNLAREEGPDRLISRQVGHGKNKLSRKASRTGSRDSDTLRKESGLMMPFSSPSSSYWKNQNRPTFYYSDSSYVARQAKKESLDRWKTTERFQEVEVGDGSRTLGEMLAVPDCELRPRSLDVRSGEQGNSSRIGPHRDYFMKPLESANRLRQRFRKQGHYQKDGLKSTISGSSCMKYRNGYLVQDDCVFQVELKRKLEEKDPCGDICPDSEHRCTIQESMAIQKELKNKTQEKVVSEQNFVITKSSAFRVASDNMVSEMVTDAENDFVSRPSGNHKVQDFEPRDCTSLVEDDDSSSQVPDTSSEQDMSFGISQEDSFSSICSCTDFESLVNAEAGYQPSPNSVLEPPFEKGISSSLECFQGAKTDLHGLQLQLELLKPESLEAYSEEDGMIVSSDDDSKEGSVQNSGVYKEFVRIFSVEESRDFSYLVDVFTEAGFHGKNSDLGYETRCSSEFPISPAVFEMLEKKYGEQMSWKRSERRLLFDRINLKLSDILQTSIGMHWTKPLLRRLCFRKSLEAVEEELWMSLVRHDKQANKDSPVKVLGQDDGWLELGDDIEVIVTDIECSLIDQLAEEVVGINSF
ncbi:uncharacterized protein LOC123193016 [Mangifera indica]|uniref:uncharacterized protein LOC123193016 n=1 Tax=Mangifera indica TaxID=29780 RepID=UPI001CF9D55E|nr:uncharacterized protein LOC123193016 [Mangifera indica]XP_044461700.1 uncharacterized protein LOC123193016 [Mangifera indica]XP_044461701.1 uncharacterized protein LOC123193016 [Mangifera indica]XP_044461702.1 uncharacterized protein LOC123193016 [Mangifera indica]XP_044461703.1 uncharacterized protein LOC123193016 [Mangifera indica]